MSMMSRHPSSSGLQFRVVCGPPLSLTTHAVKTLSFNTTISVQIRLPTVEKELCECNEGFELEKIDAKASIPFSWRIKFRDGKDGLQVGKLCTIHVPVTRNNQRGFLFRYSTSMPTTVNVVVRRRRVLEILEKKLVSARQLGRS